MNIVNPVVSIEDLDVKKIISCVEKLENFDNDGFKSIWVELGPVDKFYINPQNTQIFSLYDTNIQKNTQKV